MNSDDTKWQSRTSEGFWLSKHGTQHTQQHNTCTHNGKGDTKYFVNVSHNIYTYTKKII